MKDLVFATNNINKLLEISKLPDAASFRILSLTDIACNEELPETKDTLEGNALQKARYIFDKYNKNCFADDTGLEVEALDGRPGVYSARYAGEGRNEEENIEKLLGEMANESNRRARFRTVIALLLDGKQWLFEGVVSGVIGIEKRGSEGFGYDPVFIPEGSSRTFAEMNLKEKNSMSHRGIAVRKLVRFLKEV